MRLAKSGPDGRAASPQARAGEESPQAQHRSNDQHQHTTVARNVTAPVGDTAPHHYHHHRKIVDDTGLTQTPTTNVVHDQPPLSSIMSPELDAAHEMDFGVKFIGGLAAMPGTVSRVEPTAQPTDVTTTTNSTITGETAQSHVQQHLHSYDPTAAGQHKPPVGPIAGYAEKPRQRVEAGRPDEEHDETDCHPFWLSWRDIFLGIWLIVIGLLKIPLVIGDGMGKALHHTPELYGDKTVRKWPRLTGFPHGCVAGCLGLWYGLYDGLTDWVTLPYKAARDGGGTQACLKGFLQGLANIVLKSIAGW
ncbi:UDP-glucose-sterol transferase [Apiospora sp. TS-2023a]